MLTLDGILFILWGAKKKSGANFITIELMFVDIQGKS